MPTCQDCSKKAAAQKSEDNQAYADTTFDKDWKTTVGKETVSARHYGPAHTGGDIVITFEQANVAHMGDLMSFQRNPRADRPAGASIRNWIRPREHGQGPQPRHDLHLRPLEGRRARDRVEQGSARTARLLHRDAGPRAKGIASGKSKDEIVKVAAIPGFERYEGTPTALEAAYQELTAKS